MKGLLQRVSSARVEVGGKVIGAIEQGLLVLIAVEPHDSRTSADKLLHKLRHYRVFSDAAGKMNKSVDDVQGGLLLVSQFTLAADTRSGLRPSFSSAAPPELAAQLFDYLLTQARTRAGQVAAGEFGADMQVHLINDGPVTFMLET